jgi:geranylgeranyl transferase type-2 subunit beta
MKRSGTNPTAAAVGILQIANALDAEAREAVINFLAELVSPFEGGLRANTVIPAADLLSTFTGSWTLAQVGAFDRLDADSIGAYARMLQGQKGGFRGGLWDERADVEYTFYGLGVFALVGVE